MNPFLFLVVAIVHIAACTLVGDLIMLHTDHRGLSNWGSLIGTSLVVGFLACLLNGRDLRRGAKWLLALVFVALNLGIIALKYGREFTALAYVGIAVLYPFPVRLFLGLGAAVIQRSRPAPKRRSRSGRARPRRRRR